MIFFVFID